MKSPSPMVPPVAILALIAIGLSGTPPFLHPQDPASSLPILGHDARAVSSSNDSVVGNFSAALGRLVTLVGVSGGALLALVWARVGISWFSNDVTKKVQAKDRARDALVGTLLFVAAISGLVWGLARWVIGGG